MVAPGAFVGHQLAQDALAQAAIGDPEALGRPYRADRLEDGAAGKHKVGPVRADARIGDALLEVPADQPFDHSVDAVAVHPQAVDPAAIVAFEVEMDADGSHAPEDLPELLAALDSGGGADLVLGSRYVPGGRVVNWPAHRQLLSRGANLCARLALGAPIKDITGGYRAFRRQVLEDLDISTVASTGYCFQVDMAWRTQQAGFRVREVPITFTERELGASKMSVEVMLEALYRIATWGVAHRFRRFRRPARTA